MKNSFLFLIITALSIQIVPAQKNANPFITISNDQFYTGESVPFKHNAINYIVYFTRDYVQGDYYISPAWNVSNTWGWPDTRGQYNITNVSLETNPIIQTSTVNHLVKGDIIQFSNIAGTVSSVLNTKSIEIIEIINNNTFKLKEEDVDEVSVSTVGKTYTPGSGNVMTSGRFMFSSINDENIALTKMNNDFAHIRSLGFTVVRLAALTIKFDDNGNIVYPGGSLSTYITLLDQVLTLLSNNGLKAVLVTTADKSSYQNNQAYINFLNSISGYYSTNSTLMGYVVHAEPFYPFIAGTYGKNDKIVIGNWIYEYYHTIKKNAPNQFVSLGLQHPETVINWDYGVSTMDYASVHFYAWKSDMVKTQRLIGSYLYWLKNTYNNMWIIGETGYSGTNNTLEQDITTGTETQQLEFNNWAMQRFSDCGCKGHSWWQFQTIDWSSSIEPLYWEDHLGIVDRWNYTSQTQNDKLAASSFQNYHNIVAHPSNCTIPINYYNIDIDNGNTYRFARYVKDENGNPIANAVVVAWTYNSTTDEWHYYRVFTRANGLFYLYTNNDPIETFWISGLGYSAINEINNYSNNTYVLKKINNNNWTKRYSNDMSNKIGNDLWNISSIDKYIKGNFINDSDEELFCISPSSLTNDKASILKFENGLWSALWSNNSLLDWVYNWNLSSVDKYFAGDFDGDGKDEMLFMQVTNSNSNWHKLLSIDDWTQLVGNNNSWFGEWYIRANDKFIVGDFDGDNKEEILCMSGNSGLDWATMLNYNNGSWTREWSNEGLTDFIGNWPINTFDKYTVGDLNNDGFDELICAQYTGGSNDRIAVLEFNPITDIWTTKWSETGNGTVGIYPYRQKLVVGNFDADENDEILGINTWATKFDYVNNAPLWTWSTYDTYKLSDWVIDQNATCFFYRPISVAPDYLTVVKPSTASKFDMYTMNYLIQGSSTVLRNQSSNIQNDFEEVEITRKSTSNEIRIYPNPVNDILIFQILGDNLNGHLEVLDITGKVIMSLEINSLKTEINMSEIKEGYYFISFKGNDISYKEVFVKQ